MNILRRFLLIVWLALLNCGGSSQDSTSIRMVDDIMTHELTFGDDDSAGEYLLARPTGMDVNQNGDIYVVDEDRVKVFDETGKPKEIFGGPGQGPGEFEYAMRPIIGSAGHILVRGRSYHFFSPEHEFIKKVNYSEYFKANSILLELGLTTVYPPGVLFLFDFDEIIYDMGGEINRRDHNEYTEALFFQGPKGVVEIGHYQKMNIISTGTGREFFPPLGDLSFAPLPGKRIVYSHSSYDIETVEGVNYYIINILSVDDNSKKQIRQAYTPGKLDDAEEFMIRYREYLDSDLPDFLRSYYSTIVEKIEEKTALGFDLAPVRKILTDGEIIFVFTFVKDEFGATFTDIFNAESGQYIASAYFSFIPDRILGGYAYRLKTSESDFPVVEKFKLSPVLYTN